LALIVDDQYGHGAGVNGHVSFKALLAVANGAFFHVEDV
jgi:hypothetical protein